MGQAGDIVQGLSCVTHRRFGFAAGTILDKRAFVFQSDSTIHANSRLFHLALLLGMKLSRVPRRLRYVPYISLTKYLHGRKNEVWRDYLPTFVDLPDRPTVPRRNFLSPAMVVYRTYRPGK